MWRTDCFTSDLRQADEQLEVSDIDIFETSLQHSTHNMPVFVLCARYSLLRSKLCLPNWRSPIQHSIVPYCPSKCPPNFDSFVVFQGSSYNRPPCKIFDTTSGMMSCRKFSMVSGYTKNPEKPQNCQRFTHTRLWPHLQHSSPATRNLRTASDD